MSSPVHTARCLKREHTIVEIELGPTTATHVHFPFSRYFAFALLHESSSTHLYPPGGGEPDWRRKAAPLAHEVTFDEVIDLAGLEQASARKTALVDRFIANAGYVATRNFAPVLWKPDLSGAFIDPKISRRDRRFITASSRLQSLYDSLDHDDDQRQAPHATLRIETTDPRWCEHLEPGWNWDVYAFDDAATLFL